MFIALICLLSFQILAPNTADSTPALKDVLELTPLPELEINCTTPIDINIQHQVVKLDSMFAEVKEVTTQQRSYSGEYDLIAEVGPNDVPVNLKLEMSEFMYYGKMKVHLPTTLNVALRSDKVESDTVTFQTSSPLQTAKFWAVDKDSLAGLLILNNGVEVSLRGKRKEKNPESFAEEFKQFSVFEEGLISKNDRGEAFITFAPDEDELLVSTYSDTFGEQTVYHAQMSDEGWSIPEIAWFSGKYSDRSPMFSPDGNQIYFASTRPDAESTDEKEDYDLWMISKTKEGKWGQPELLEVLNSESNDYQPSVTNNGIYFISDRKGGMGGQDVYHSSHNSNGEFSKPVLMPANINSDGSEISVFVDPKEKYMILSTSKSLEDSKGNDDLYLLENENNYWGQPINLGDKINSFVNEYGAFVSRDRQTLYFGSDISPPANIYRADFDDLVNEIVKK